MKDSLTFHLGSFSGPLEFLIALVQNEELTIEDIPLKEITRQYLISLKDETNLDSGAEFVGSTSFLIWFKSRELLPKHEQQVSAEDEQDPRFEVIHHLLDYCRFRDAAKALADREQKQSHFYFRGTSAPIDVKKNLGIEHLTLDDFASLFKQLVAKAAPSRGIIHEEEWRVSDKIAHIKALVANDGEVAFEHLFNNAVCREELIVIFLAVLELMKEGIVSIVKLSSTGEIMIAAKEKYGARN